MGVCVTRISIADNHRGMQFFSSRQGHARCGPLHDIDLVNFCALPDGATLGAHNIRHRICNRLHTAHGVMHAKFLFKIPNQRVH